MTCLHFPCRIFPHFGGDSLNVFQIVHAQIFLFNSILTSRFGGLS